MNNTSIAKTVSRVAALAAVVLATTSAFAAPQNMPTGQQTSQPIGHHEFCQRYSNECGEIASNPVAPATLTREKWAAMLEVNVGVNRTIQPLTDRQIHGTDEVWSYPTTVGDCEDYVLLKRRQLMDRGFSAGQLPITVVLQPDGSGHAVLTVRTDHGDFILDNMRDRILLWSDSEYTFLKRQSSQHAGRWTTIDDDRAPLSVGAVR